VSWRYREKEIVLVLILFIATARLLLDSMHSRTASKEIIFTYLASALIVVKIGLAISRLSYYYMTVLSQMNNSLFHL